MKCIQKKYLLVVITMIIYTFFSGCSSKKEDNATLCLKVNTEYIASESYDSLNTYEYQYILENLLKAHLKI